jgi:hypothetical protein
MLEGPASATTGGSMTRTLVATCQGRLAQRFVGRERLDAPCLGRGARFAALPFFDVSPFRSPHLETPSQ